eukprot:GHVS01104234.1.p1 GENE.GHVS01104234.1~~GHVS01104234.1.p1  ORF type:complete len:718 (-),score=71.18 GHVS01104234.1:732-2885(-)
MAPPVTFSSVDRPLHPSLMCVLSVAAIAYFSGVVLGRVMVALHQLLRTGSCDKKMEEDGAGGIERKSSFDAAATTVEIKMVNKGETKQGEAEEDVVRQEQGDNCKQAEQAETELMEVQQEIARVVLGTASGSCHDMEGVATRTFPSASSSHAPASLPSSIPPLPAVRPYVDGTITSSSSHPHTPPDPWSHREHNHDDVENNSLPLPSLSARFHSRYASFLFSRIRSLWEDTRQGLRSRLSYDHVYLSRPTACLAVTQDAEEQEHEVGKGKRIWVSWTRKEEASWFRDSFRFCCHGFTEFALVVASVALLILVLLWRLTRLLLASVVSCHKSMCNILTIAMQRVSKAVVNPATNTTSATPVKVKSKRILRDLFFFVGVCLLAGVDSLQCVYVRCWLLLYSALVWVLGEAGGLSELLPHSGSTGGKGEEEGWVEVDRRRVVFIRHGESFWNWCVNQPSFILRVYRAFLYLILELSTCFHDPAYSLMFDSPLSAEGVRQASCLGDFLAGGKNPVGREKLDVEKDAVFATSNLRRTISTMRIAADSLMTHQSLFILSSLQESARNPDAISLAPPFPLLAPVVILSQSFISQATGGLRPPPALPDVVLRPLAMTTTTRQAVDNSFNNGNPRLLGSRVVDRLHDFAEWLFQRKPATVIACGHSIWIKKFFCRFLPMDHAVKHRKLVNCGCVQFDLLKLGKPGSSDIVYRVDFASISLVYGGLA